MIARMCKATGVFCGLIVLLLLGCAAPPDQKPGGFNQKPVSTVHSVDLSDIPEKGGPEILPDTHFAAGRLHEHNGHLTRAVEQYRLAIGLNPDHIEAYNRLGIVLARLGRFKESEEVYQQAIELTPDQVYLRNNLAFDYIMQARWAEAEDQLIQTLEKSPDFMRARINFALVLAQQEHFDEAMIQFRMALPAEDAHYNMGLMYQSKRRLLEAAQAYKSALEANPKFAAAKKRLEKLPPDVVEKANQQHAEAVASPLPTFVEDESDLEMGTRTLFDLPEYDLDSMQNGEE